jgi:hypothetical protein
VGASNARGTLDFDSQVGRFNPTVQKLEHASLLDYLTSGRRRRKFPQVVGQEYVPAQLHNQSFEIKHLILYLLQACNLREAKIYIPVSKG